MEYNTEQNICDSIIYTAEQIKWCTCTTLGIYLISKTRVAGVRVLLKKRKRVKETLTDLFGEHANISI